MRHLFSGRGGLAAAAAMVLCISLTACSERGGPSAPGSTAEVADLGLQGPWAQEFADAISKSQSVYERGILADGVVDPTEVADAHAHVQRCLGDSGYRIGYDSDGGFEVEKLRGGHASDDMSATNRVLEACEGKYDQFISFLYEQTRRNPQKEDEAKITVACLRQSGLVGKDYTERQWRADNDTGVWPFDDYDPRAVQCRLDPLGLWREP